MITLLMYLWIILCPPLEPTPLRQRPAGTIARIPVIEVMR